MEPINVFELEAIAREKLSPEAFDYYLGGAGDEVTLRDNRAAYDRLSLAYRVLVDVSRRDPATAVLGQPVSMPVLVAPTAFHRLADPEGELATARAAGAAGTVMILSTLSTTRVEEVVAASSGLAAYVSDLLDPSLSWRDVAWLQSITGLPVLVKGIVRPDDAVRAAEAGAAGVVVSNHGGRQLDTAPATLDVLPEIVDALA